ncbi:hypothetical protein A3843_02295 [Pseudovibrio exalbescens]|uniref:Uncharacterized protein n=1 Tax=Pseudovibrio exalbescens TaxID=197461 RepID=A0A1U7JKF3_9HYPH|nr:hypothetical protein A3843_02295 [Pseudovibrio exalbescens]
MVSVASVVSPIKTSIRQLAGVVRECVKHCLIWCEAGITFLAKEVLSLPLVAAAFQGAVSVGKGNSLFFAEGRMFDPQ